MADDIELDDSNEISIDDAINSAMGEVFEEPEAKPRDEKGKFAKTEPVAEVAEPVSETVETPETTTPTFTPKWRKEALEKYSTLDPVVKAEIEKREQDFHKGIEVYKQGAQQAQAWEQSLQPFMSTIQQYGEPPQKIAQYLFAVDHQLRVGTPEQKAQIVAQIARSAGVDLGNIQAAPEVPSELQTVMQRQQDLERRIMEREQREQQAEIQTLNSTIQEFSKTAPHFESVKQEMAALLQTGQAATLQEAYDKAVWLNPDIRSQILAKQQADESAKRQEVAKAAKKASVTNIPKRGYVPAKANNATTLDDVIRSEMEQIGIG